MSGPSQPPARHADPARLAAIADRADLTYLMRRLATLGVICATHKDDRMGMLADVTRDGSAYIERSPRIKTAHGTLLHAREDYGTAHNRSNSHDAELEERTWAAVVQAGQELAAALQDLPEADPRALRGLPGECFVCRMARVNDPLPPPARQLDAGEAELAEIAGKAIHAATDAGPGENGIHTTGAAVRSAGGTVCAGVDLYHSDQAAARLNELIDNHRHLYIGNGTESLTAENATEIPDPGKDTGLELE